MAVTVIVMRMIALLSWTLKGRQCGTDRPRRLVSVGRLERGEGQGVMVRRWKDEKMQGLKCEVKAVRQSRLKALRRRRPRL